MRQQNNHHFFVSFVVFVANHQSDNPAQHPVIGKLFQAHRDQLIH